MFYSVSFDLQQIARIEYQNTIVVENIYSALKIHDSDRIFKFSVLFRYLFQRKIQITIGVENSNSPIALVRNKQ
jgi:hypothetical protein